jgi:hypothetical protein
MPIIKDKVQLRNFLNKFFLDYKKYNLPKFSSASNSSFFFQKNTKKLIQLVNSNKTNDKKFEKLVLSSYFSSKKVIEKINIINKNNLKSKKIKFNKRLFDRKYKNKLI